MLLPIESAHKTAGYLTLVPAYGRDYKSKREVVEAWDAGKDFIVQDMMSPYDGKPINKADAKAAGIANVNIRYKGMRSVAVIKVAAGKAAFGERMQSATEHDYNAALRNAPRARKEHIDGGSRSMTVEHKDRGTLVASKTISYSRGKVSQVYYMVNPDYLPGGSMARQAKFPKGEKMTVDEVAEVVGPEFKEMNENPPESVKKLRKEMEEAMGADLLPVERAAAGFLQGEDLYDALKKIVDEKQYAKVNGQMVDLFSASGMVQVADALNEKNRARFLSMPIEKMHSMTFKMLKSGGDHHAAKQKLPDELKKHQFTSDDNPNPKGNDKDGDGKTGEKPDFLKEIEDKKGKKASRRKSASGNHHVAPNGDIFVDTAFLNATKGIPGVSLGHMGFGEFYADTPKGRVDFDRMRGKDFPGQSGRSHKLYGEGNAADWLLDQMIRKGQSVESGSRMASDQMIRKAFVPDTVDGWLEWTGGSRTAAPIDDLFEMKDVRYPPEVGFIVDLLVNLGFGKGYGSPDAVLRWVEAGKSVPETIADITKHWRKQFKSTNPKVQAAFLKAMQSIEDNAAPAKEYPTPRRRRG